MMIPRSPDNAVRGAAARRRWRRRAARAQLTIDMTRPSFEPVPIAIVDFQGDPIGAQIAGVIRNDLQNSGLFRSIAPGSFIEHDRRRQRSPALRRLAQVGAAGLVVGSVQPVPAAASRSTSACGTCSPSSRRPGLRFTSQPSNWRRLAHIIADAIYKRVTGEEGYFDTRVVYVAETGPLNGRVKRLAIMDQDGANNRYLTDGRTIVLTPRFSPTLQEIIYMSYAERHRRASTCRTSTPDRSELLGDFPGMTLRAALLARRHRRWSMSRHRGRRDESIRDGPARPALRRLTNAPAIDTSPCYSPRRHADRLQLRPRRLAAALRHERRRRRRAAHQLRRRPLRHAGLVAARRLIAFTKIERRQLLHRRDAARRLAASGC